MDRPLRGVRVLDLGQIYQGPYAGMILSYMGADVIKVERPGGEMMRFRNPYNEPPEIQFLNATKRGIEVDLKSEAGRDVLRDLVAESDVLLENFSQGKLAELGVGYDDLTAVNPELVYAHASGFGDTGPYSDHKAMDLVIQAVSGTMHTTGWPDSPPTKTGPAFIDFLGGIHVAAGILAALYEREVTGEGQYVESAMFDCTFPALASIVKNWAQESDAPSRTGNRHSGLSITPYNAYEVADGYVACIPVTDRQFETLCGLMGKEEWIEDERYNSRLARVEHLDTVEETVAEWFSGRDRDETVELLRDHDIPCAPVQSVDEVLSDPHLEARGMLNWMPNKDDGKEELPVPGSPIKFPMRDDLELAQSPGVGEHTDEVLAEVAGYSSGEIDRLREEDAV